MADVIHPAKVPALVDELEARIRQESTDCICQPGDFVCLGVPGETDGCGACLTLDPEAPCVIEFEPEPDRG